MSSLNDYIKFTLDIEDKNIIFSDYSNENINGKIYKIYLAELIQPTCPFCPKDFASRCFFQGAGSGNNVWWFLANLLT